jgi:hypothetical protein
MIRTRTRTLTFALLVALALAVAGCGGSNSSSTTSHKQASTGSGQTATASTPATTSQTATTTTPTTTQTTTTTTTGNSGGVPVSGSVCTAADLTPAFLNTNGATGHVVMAFVLKNTGTATCHTYGYPGVAFLSKSGAPLTTNATRTTTDFAGHLPESALTLAPGQEASFRMVTSDVGSSQSDCANAYGLQVIAPDDTATMKTSIPEAISFCDGKATVSPLVAGTGASST